MTELTTGQSIALGQHLHSWPRSESFDTILAILRGEIWQPELDEEAEDYDEDENEMVSVWEPLEDIDPEILSDHIQALASAIDAEIKQSFDEGFEIGKNDR